MYKVLKDFRGSPDGCRVIDYKKDDLLDIGSDFSEDLAAVAVEEGWAIKIAHKTPSQRKAKKSKK